MNHKQSIKEVIKHTLYKIGVGYFLNMYRRKRGYVTNHLKTEGARERFSEIYKLGAWVHDGEQKSLSGLGSESVTTRKLVEKLPIVLKELNCRVMLDIGCGDWNWMSKVRLPCEYIGTDIVPEVIDGNKKHERTGVSFILANAIEDELPKADVVFIREVLFHLSFNDSKAVIANVKKKSKWLLATTDNSIWFNSDIQTGDFRNINLEYPPYNFPPPYKIIIDNALSSGRILGIWKTCDLF